jgi:YHS domain-containing protein
VVKLAILALIAYLGWRAWRVVREDRAELRGEAKAEARAARKMVRDPVCGAYVPEQTAERISVDGRLVHFCGPECREAYLKGRQGEKG